MEIKDTEQPVKSQVEIDAETRAAHNVEVKEKAEELSKREGVKVTPILFYQNGNLADPIKGYLKEPTRIAKVAIMDKSEQAGNYTAGAEMLEICLLKADSDMRLTSLAQQYDDIYLGAVLECQKLIQASINQVKKN